MNRLNLECGHTTVTWFAENTKLSNWFNGTIYCEICKERKQVLEKPTLPLQPQTMIEEYFVNN
jgi:hypothetical protein